jgi:hypothetical protein
MVASTLAAQHGRKRREWSLVRVVVNTQRGLVAAIWITARHDEPADPELPKVPERQRRTGKVPDAGHVMPPKEPCIILATLRISFAMISVKGRGDL